MDGTRRYERHIVLSEIGDKGQERLFRSRVVIVGLGALGGNIAVHMVRAGIGFIRLIDRDIVEEENLQRQILYDEADVEAGLPKAVAAARHLAKINSSIKLDPCVAELTSRNAETLLSGFDIIMDGTDNLRTRFLINDFSLKTGVPWIYGAVLATFGVVAPVVPTKTPCLRCILRQIPAHGTLPTCQTHGVLNTLPSLVAALQTTLAYRLLLSYDVKQSVFFVDLWDLIFEEVEISSWDECPTCGKRLFEFLEGGDQETFSLCGRNAVQINPKEDVRITLELLKARLEGRVEVEDTGYFLRIRVEGYELLVFADGRIIVKGTDDPTKARGVVSRYIGL